MSKEVAQAFSQACSSLSDIVCSNEAVLGSQPNDDLEDSWDVPFYNEDAEEKAANSLEQDPYEEQQEPPSEPEWLLNQDEDPEWLNKRYLR